MIGNCQDRDGLHIHKGNYVYGVPGYPLECMECGSPIPLHPRHLISNPSVLITPKKPTP